MNTAAERPHRSLRRLAWIAGTGVALAAAALPLLHHGGPPARAAAPPAAVPVTVTTVARASRRERCRITTLAGERSTRCEAG